MGYENIEYSVEGNIGVLTVNRPKALNALNFETLREISSLLSDEFQKGELRGLIITGAGKAFVAGADIAQMNQMDKEQFNEYVEFAHEVFSAIENGPCPVIAAVNGYALGGGCEFSLACDIRVASEKAMMGFPEVKLGLFPAWGGTQRATRILGPGKAKELIFTGEMIKAEDAHRIGLVEKVVPHDELMSSTMELANTIAARGPVAVGIAKTVINAGAGMELEKALSMDRSYASICFDSEDRAEGMSAFLEKRDPSFKGK